MDLSKYTDSIIKTIQTLVQIKTVEDTPVPGGPFGKGNKECLEKALEIAASLGFRVKNLDGYCGYAEIGDGDELVGIIGHLDVVPEGEGWKYPPYSGALVDGEIWGRGSIDDKGPIVISLYAIKALMDSGFKFNKRVRVIFGCNEESGSRCMEHYLKVDEPISYGVSPDAEFPVIFAEKSINNIRLHGKAKNSGMVTLKSFDAGIVINAVPDKCKFVLEYGCDKCKARVMNHIKETLEKNDIKFEFVDENNTLTYTVFGKAAHGSVPQYGINAGSYAIDALFGEIDDDFVDFYHEVIGLGVHGEKMGCFIEDEYGPIACNVGIVKYENNEFNILINSRLPFNITSDEMINRVRNTISKYDFVTLDLLGSSQGFIMDKESPMIKALVKAYRDVTGDLKTEPICCAGGTYAREFSNCVAFGPEMNGYGEMIIHQPNERLSVKAVEDIMKIYYQAYKDLIEKVSFKK